MRELVPKRCRSCRTFSPPLRGKDHLKACQGGGDVRPDVGRRVGGLAATATYWIDHRQDRPGLETGIGMTSSVQASISVR